MKRWVAPSQLFAMAMSCLACQTETPPPAAPPPLPSGPAETAQAQPPAPASAPAPQAAPAATYAEKSAARSHATEGHKPAEHGESLYDMVKHGEAEMPAAAKEAPASVPTSKPTTPTSVEKPAVAAPQPAPTPAKPPATKVDVPRTSHVHVDVPQGLQADLDHDPRMQPWLAQAIRVLDGCYVRDLAGNANAAGVVQVKITMHENDRPDGEIKSLPPALSSVVACATGGLMGSRMPLFTGKEGQQYSVGIHFDK